MSTHERSFAKMSNMMAAPRQGAGSLVRMSACFCPFVGFFGEGEREDKEDVAESLVKTSSV